MILKSFGSTTSHWFLLRFLAFSRPRVSLHGVFMFSPCMREFLLGTPASSHMTVRLIGFYKLALDVDVCVHSCLCCMSLCCPAMDWRPVQGVLCLSPIDCWR
ncbi:hypothetical protein AMECASPLE_037727 [Ameca splendens]|uniref:Secreted protein n=1 Tax=Ameca splendens TaxID=208324 RepID=A0ABV0ZUC8_9TELE